MAQRPLDGVEAVLSHPLAYGRGVLGAVVVGD
jgi:hypothetical protein